MPHVNIKHYPREFTDTEKDAVAAAVTALVTQHFNVPDEAVSIALEPVAQPQWATTVRAAEIDARTELLIKRPGRATT